MADEPGPEPLNPWRDLVPRTASALILIPIAVGAAWAGGPWLAGAAGAAVVVMSYEWARMSEPVNAAPAFALTVAGALGALILTGWGAVPLAAAVLCGCALLAALRRSTPAQGAESLFGLLYVGAPPAAFVWLRDHEPGGAIAALALFAIIWSADVAAYFGGRAIGGPRFAPILSPQKTWAGVACGFGAGVLCGVVFGAWVDGPVLLWGAIAAGVSLVGLGGDLIESFAKRRFGVKDASRIIPGHGGMLDRLDGLMAASLAASAATAVFPGLLSMLSGG